MTTQKFKKAFSKPIGILVLAATLVGFGSISGAATDAEREMAVDSELQNYGVRVKDRGFLDAIKTLGKTSLDGKTAFKSTFYANDMLDSGYGRGSKIVAHICKDYDLTRDQYFDIVMKIASSPEKLTKFQEMAKALIHDRAGLATDFDRRAAKIFTDQIAKIGNGKKLHKMRGQVELITGKKQGDILNDGQLSKLLDFEGEIARELGTNGGDYEAAERTVMDREDVGLDAATDRARRNCVDHGAADDAVGASAG